MIQNEWEVTFPQANDRQCLPLYLHADKFTSFPLAIFQTSTAFRDFSRHGHHQSDCMLSCSANVPGRRIDHHNAKFCSFVDIFDLINNALTML